MGNCISSVDEEHDRKRQNVLLEQVVEQNKLLRQMVERRDTAMDRMTDSLVQCAAGRRLAEPMPKANENGVRNTLQTGPRSTMCSTTSVGSIKSLHRPTLGKISIMSSIDTMSAPAYDNTTIYEAPKGRSTMKTELKDMRRARKKREAQLELDRKGFYDTLHTMVHTKMLMEKYKKEEIQEWREKAKRVSNWVTDQKVMEMAAKDWDRRLHTVAKHLEGEGKLTDARRRWLFACQYCYAITKLPLNRVAYNKYLGSCYMRTYNSLHISKFNRNIKMALLRIYRGDDSRYTELPSASLHYTMSKGDTKAMEIGDKFHVKIYCGSDYSPTIDGEIKDIDYETRKVMVSMDGGSAEMPFQMPILEDPNRPDATVNGAWMFHGSPKETGDGVYVIKAVGSDNVVTFYEHLQGNLKECCGLKCPLLPPCRDLRLICKILKLEDDNKVVCDYGYFTHERDENDANPKITGCYRIRWTRHVETGGPDKMLSIQIFKTCSSGKH